MSQRGRRGRRVRPRGPYAGKMVSPEVKLQTGKMGVIDMGMPWAEVEQLVRGTDYEPKKKGLYSATWRHSRLILVPF